MHLATTATLTLKTGENKSYTNSSECIHFFSCRTVTNDRKTLFRQTEGEEANHPMKKQNQATKTNGFGFTLYFGLNTSTKRRQNWQTTYKEKKYLYEYQMMARNAHLFLSFIFNLIIQNEAHFIRSILGTSFVPKLSKSLVPFRSVATCIYFCARNSPLCNGIPIVKLEIEAKKWKNRRRNPYSFKWKWANTIRENWIRIEQNV